MLIGEYHHNIDEKGRLIIPSKFREDIGDEFVITRGLDGCLAIYGLKEWNNIVSKLKALPFTKKDARTFTRFFMSSASTLELDKQGRINIPSNLINYANLQKECTIIGVNDRLEIWASDKFNSLIEENITAIDDVAENLFEGLDIDA